MPELPEVETIKRELKPVIINQKIARCRILRRDIIGYPDPERFCRYVIGEEIIDVKRRAKYLIIELSNNKRLIFHLRLSGRIFVSGMKDAKIKANLIQNRDKEIYKEQKFFRLILELENQRLIFSEPRALGRVYLLKGNEQPEVLKGFFNLSCEPLSPEYDFLYFKERLKNHKAFIKQLLLDQSICAGVGNIYADEALFRAGIKPTRRVHRVTNGEIFKLLLSIKEVLNKGIKNFGTTVSDYRRTDGRTGNFQNFLYVYDREGRPCRICGSKIVLTKIGNRSTRYCPKCQK